VGWLAAHLLHFHKRRVLRAEDIFTYTVRGKDDCGHQCVTVILQVLNILFLLWWILPLIVLPIVRRNVAKAREQGYGTSGRSSGSGTSPGFGNPGFGAQRKYQGEGQVIDAEWTSLDDDTSSSFRRRKR
jgi:hypothetical protein